MPTWTNDAKPSAPSFSNDAKSAAPSWLADPKGGQPWMYDEPTFAYDQAAPITYETVGSAPAWTNDSKS